MTFCVSIAASATRQLFKLRGRSFSKLQYKYRQVLYEYQRVLLEHSSAGALRLQLCQQTLEPVHSLMSMFVSSILAFLLFLLCIDIQLEITTAAPRRGYVCMSI
jgi:hypothetical protein